MRRSLDFYRRVLGFEQGGGQGADAYTPMVNGAVRLALNLRSELLSDHPIQRASDRLPRPGPDGYYWRVTSGQ